jgi:hypothetical protein
VREINTLDESGRQAFWPVHRHVLIIFAQLDPTVFAGKCLAAEESIALEVALRPCRRISALMFDLAVEQLKPTIAAGSHIAGIGETDACSQSGAQDSILFVTFKGDGIVFAFNGNPVHWNPRVLVVIR